MSKDNHQDSFALAPRIRDVRPHTPPASPAPLDVDSDTNSRSPPASPSSSAHPSPLKAKTKPTEPLDETLRDVLTRLRALHRGFGESEAVRAELSGAQYRALQHAIAADQGLAGWFSDKARSAWTERKTKAGLFVVHMPTPIHDEFADSLNRAIASKIDEEIKHARGEGKATRAELMSKIKSRTTSWTKLDAAGSYRDPDAGFSFRGNAIRMVAIEIAYAHNPSPADVAAEYIKAGTHAVIMADLQYHSPGERASAPPTSGFYWIYRRVRTRKTNGRFRIHSRCVVDRQPFLRDIGQPNAEVVDGSMQLRLSDFCPTDRLQPDSQDDLTIEISHGQLASCLHEAEEEQKLYDSHKPGLASDEDWESDHVPGRRMASALDSDEAESELSSQPSDGGSDWTPAAARSKKVKT
ncbi:hypothetical protein BU26DRAFT_522720 [Trematosphaeria pertusa]|uniref:Uncharacterized protein n=1 Tax=Trematosphaeria pertusa TaxID=390896 RepID=A0A6A6I3W3_9PLEO|nr:uncharacterized protein BU26DRAFT_522720 [Trematosphaeria pertusa]KAF2245031.1 hypothetical protein BU26DRAFT_522720 [Trematosphaeria pertusa]